jgi:hypothetical protein
MFSFHLRGLLKDLFDIMAQIEDLLVGRLITLFYLQRKICTSQNHLTNNINLILILKIIAYNNQLKDQAEANY